MKSKGNTRTKERIHPEKSKGIRIHPFARLFLRLDVEKQELRQRREKGGGCKFSKLLGFG